MVFRLVPAPMLALLGQVASARAAELVVKVTGIRSDLGEIGCALYASRDGFPMEGVRASAQWQPAQQPQVGIGERDVAIQIQVAR